MRKLLIAFVCLLFTSLDPVLAQEQAIAEQALVIRKPDSGVTLRDFLAAVRQQGGRPRHIFPPDAAIIELPARGLGAWETAFEVQRGPVQLATATARSQAAGIAANAWNSRFLQPKLLPGDLAGPRESAEERKPDFRIAPDVRGPLPPGGAALVPSGAGFYDTSEFLMGSIAVGVFLMESSGSAYNWSSSEITQTLNGIYAGMEWWINRGGTAANLSFTYDIHTQQPTNYEPIQTTDEEPWISEAMAALGYSSGGAFQQTRQYLNDLRNAQGTHWAFAIFVADSSSSVNQGRFPDNFYAWAYYGGPWVIMSRYSSWAYNAGNYYQAVPAHEMGHIFYASDEYDGSSTSSGYLNANDNDGASCLMNQNSLGNLCAASTLQVGWRDSDGDGIHDILDTEPATTLSVFAPDPTSQTALEYTGTANVVPLNNLNPNGFGNDITIQTITGVEFRVDSGTWMAATPVDGTFNGPTESFRFTTPTLTAGTHTIQARAVTSVGTRDSTPASDTVTVSPGSHTLSVSKAGAGSGTVTSSPAGINCGTDCSEPYSSGTIVTLTATPGTGSTFAGWSGACSGTGSCAVTMNAAQSVTATFSASLYTLSVSRAGTGSGTVTSSPTGINCGTDCSEVYASGTIVTLTATPGTGSTFTGWSGACSGTGSCAVTMNAAQSVTATFSVPNTSLLTYVRTHWNGTGGISQMDRVEAVTISADGKHLYATSYYSGAVLVFSRNTSNGDLSVLQILQDGNGADGLAGAQALALSPDGRHLYVVGLLENALSVFARDPATGLLTLGVILRDGFDGVDGLSWITAVTVSPDGRHVYTSSIVDRAVASFERNEGNGVLTPIGIVWNGDPGVSGLERPESLTMSPDGKQLYVASSDGNALLVFQRNTTTGTLSVSQVLKDGISGIDGLAGASSVSVSPGGQHVHVTASVDHSLTAFQRNATTGNLTFLSTLRDGTGGVDGLQGASSVTPSLDGRFLYVTGMADHSLSVFDRNPATGAVTFRESHRNWLNGINGLSGAKSLAFSPDERYIYAGSVFDEAIVTFARQGYATTYNLTVTKTGAGDGTISSSPAGIFCGSDCAESFVPGALVTLTAVPKSGSTFLGWTGACSGTGSCTVTLSAAASATASFSSTDPQLLSGVARTDTMTATTRQGSWRYYWIDIPSGAANLVVELTNLTADADLYVRYGERPGLAGAHDCRPFIDGPFPEQCTFATPTAGRWWIGVNNWDTGSLSYTLQAQWTQETYFYTIPPCRVLDSRQAGTPLTSGVPRQVQISGLCNIPATAKAVSLNLTAIQGTAGGVLDLWPSGTEVHIGSIYFTAGQTRANNSILALSPDGLGTLTAQSYVEGGGTVHMVIDLNGYFQ